MESGIYGGAKKFSRWRWVEFIPTVWRFYVVSHDKVYTSTNRRFHFDASFMLESNLVVLEEDRVGCAHDFR